MKRKTTEVFIQDAYCKHGDRYNYKLSKYINAKTKVKIICHKHGIFEQLPSSHSRAGQGCPNCNYESRRSGNLSDIINYKSKVWSYTNKIYKEYYHLINPDNIKRDRDNHLDHKYSISEGFRYNIPVYIISSYHNLEIIRGFDNIRKGSSCSITKEELIKKVLH